jgi:hypothetical protein
MPTITTLQKATTFAIGRDITSPFAELAVLTRDVITPAPARDEAAAASRATAFVSGRFRADETGKGPLFKSGF